jgi:predicted DNA-binding antitoxin AbrB/MazE fold protein
MERLHLLEKVERQEGTKVRIRLKSQARGLTSGMESVSPAFIDLKEFHIA